MKKEGTNENEKATIIENIERAANTDCPCISPQEKAQNNVI